MAFLSRCDFRLKCNPLSRHRYDIEVFLAAIVVELSIKLPQIHFKTRFFTVVAKVRLAVIHLKARLRVINHRVFHQAGFVKIQHFHPLV